jgi:amidase
MARNAGDLSLALDVIAGPDEPQVLAYSLALSAPRHRDLRDFRVLVMDAHPVIPADAETRSTLAGLADNLVKAGAKVERSSPLLPDLMITARTYTQLLTSIFGTDMPIDAYRRIQELVASLAADDTSLAASRLRGMVLSHRDWMLTDRVRSGLTACWREFFRHFDIVLCPVMPTPAFPHDHSPEHHNRRIKIDGIDHPYLDQIHWSGIATLIGLPTTVVPIDRSRGGLPIGAQIIGPYLEDRTPLAFAELLEREYGGFVAPPGC